jgi:hypothetical protein
LQIEQVLGIKLWINKGQTMTYPQGQRFLRSYPVFEDSSGQGWPTSLKRPQMLVLKQEIALVHKPRLPLSTTTNLKSKSIEN